MSILDTLEPAREADCISDLGFDQLAAGELAEDRMQAMRAHVAQCARCTERSAALQRARAEFERAPGLLARPRKAPARARRAPWIAGAGALALAAAVVLVLRPHVPDDSGLRSKGAATLGFFVRHRGQVRRGAQGEVVAPGDALRFSYSARAAGYFAVLSLDGQHRGSVYFPAAPETHAQRIEAGHDVLLPISTELDAVTGSETLFGVFCDAPVVLEPLRLALEREPVALAAAGCSVDRVTITKQAEGELP